MREQWQKIIDTISLDAEAVYEITPTGHRLMIHELCKITNSPKIVLVSTDELSDDDDDDEEDDDDDDDDDDDEDEDEDDDESLKKNDQECVGNAIGVVNGGCIESQQVCELQEDRNIYEFAQFMINVSHSLGPIRVATFYDEQDNSEGIEISDVDQDEDVTHDEEQARLTGEEIVNILGNESDDDSNDSRSDHHHQRVENDNYTTNCQYHSSVLTVRDAMGKTPLHILCENSCDINMMRIIIDSTQENTGNLSAPTALSLILAKDLRGCTPLHYLAFSRCPFSSLKLVMNYCKPSSHFDDDKCTDILPDPTLCTDEDGDTPLHWALDGYMSCRRIKELTRYSLDALMVVNQKKERPFDQFVTNFDDTNWTIHDVRGRGVWEKILSYLLEGIRDVDHSEEWLPLHFIAGFSYYLPPVFTDLALHNCGNDLQKFDSNGMIPLHLACGRQSACSVEQQQQNESCNDSIAMKILNKNPSGALQATKTTKRLAIHLAVETQKSLSLITALVKKYPKSISIPDPVTKLWPCVLAIVDNDESVSVSYALLRADPSILQLVKFYN